MGQLTNCRGEGFRMLQGFISVDSMRRCHLGCTAVFRDTKLTRHKEASAHTAAIRLRLNRP